MNTEVISYRQTSVSVNNENAQNRKTNLFSGQTLQEYDQLRL